MHNEQTLEKAKSTMYHFLKDNPNRLKHTLQVVDNLKQIASEQGICKPDSYYLLLEAGYLHDIGYSPILNKVNFHPYDGYRYLIDNDFPEDVAHLVLHHTYSALLYSMQDKNPILESVYESNTILKVYNTLLDYLALADMTSSPTGEHITMRERVEDIMARYGVDSAVSQHAIQVKNNLHYLQDERSPLHFLMSGQDFPPEMKKDLRERKHQEYERALHETLSSTTIY